MNVSSTVLFPGLDGLARSLGDEPPFYDEFYLYGDCCYLRWRRSNAFTLERRRAKGKRNSRAVSITADV